MRRWLMQAMAVAAVAVLGAAVGLAQTGGAWRSRPPRDTGEEPSGGTSSPVRTAAEWRGVWLAYTDLNERLAGTDPAGAAAVLDAVMDDCAARGLTAVMFHARPNSDAYYASRVFPVAAEVADLVAAGFDPLAYAVDAAHRRGLELHAWINPYRVGKNADNARCEAVFSAGERWYYVPSSLTAQALILEGAREIADGYAVDGIHLDDYFYPADDAIPAAAPAAFEQEDYAAYRQAGGELAIGDWRRAAVTALVAGLTQIAHAHGIVCGVSPGHNLDRCCRSAYADVATWAAAGLVGYLCPQIYFGFAHSTAAFDTVAAAWLALPRADGVRLYTGLAVYKAGWRDDPYAGDGAGEWAADDTVLAREVRWWRQAGGDGFCLFRYRYLSADPTDAGCDAAVARRQLEGMWEAIAE